MLSLNIETDNDAFQGNEAEEVARILENLAARLRSEGALPSGFWSLLDLNGNRVGLFALVPDDKLRSLLKEGLDG
jgi:hypothetical protein